MNTYFIKSIFSLCLTLLIFTGCKNDSFKIQEETLENFHIKKIDKELQIVAKAINTIIQEPQNVALIKDAIYKKKKDENITLKDLYKYFNEQNSSSGAARAVNFEQSLLTNINQQQAMSLEELRTLVDFYDLSIYWEYIQLWDGTTPPQVGYPTNEEEDVNNDYEQMSYKVYASVEDLVGNYVIRSYLEATPVILVRPLENFENGSEPYYSDQTYVWLEDMENLEEDTTQNEPNSGALRTTQNISQLSLYAINTNGNVFDGSGGPEFRFWRVGIDAFITGNISDFTNELNYNLTASAAKTTSWIYPRNTVDDILDHLWLVLKWRQTFGCYEKDGGLNRQKVFGLVITATLAKVITGEIEFFENIDNRDDKIYQHDLPWTSYSENIQLNKAFYTSWGKFNDRPIHLTDHPDLKIAYSKN